MRTVSLFLFLMTSLVCSGQNQDVSLYYEESGVGETIIFIHGGQEDYQVFLPQLKSLENSFRCITYSRRYNFPNEQIYEQGTAFDPGSEAEDLERLRKELGIVQFHVVGHSYGGLIALAYAEKYKHRLRSLILSEPPVLHLEECREALNTTQNELLNPLKKAFSTKDTTQAMKVIFEFFVGKDIREELPPEVLTSLNANLGEMEALAYSENPFPKLRTSFDIPTLIFTSENLMPVLVCANKTLIEQNPKARHIQIQGASHAMWMTHPIEMSNHLKEFLLNN